MSSDARALWLVVAVAVCLVSLGCKSPATPPCQPRTYLADLDGDGFGDERHPVVSCEGQEGTTEVNGDCDDLDGTRSPSATEVCDGVDNDCDGEVNEGVLNGCGTCGPLPEEVCDGVDNDCDGEVDEAPLERRTWFVDADGDGVGSVALMREDCRQPDGFVDVSGDCNDAEPRARPGLPEVCHDGLDNDCDGTANDCELRGWFGLRGVPDIIVPDLPSGRFGWSIDCRGDSNDDGFDDVIIGQPSTQTANDSFGYVYFLPGPIEGHVSVATHGGRFSSSSINNSAIGQVVSLWKDRIENSANILVGSSYTFHQGVCLITSPFPEHGELLPSASIGRQAEPSEKNFGYSLSGILAINNDGVNDFAVASSANNSNISRASRVYVFAGNINHEYSLGNSWLLVGEEQPIDQAGFSLAGPGDVTGDGAADFLVGAPKSGRGNELGGLVYVVASPMDTSAERLVDVSHLLVGYEPGAQAGYSVSGAGDTDGDGAVDLLVGAPLSGQGSEAGRGTVYLVRGPIVEDTPLEYAATRLHGEGRGDQAGWSVSGAGDVNGDGFDDVLIGAPLNSDNGTEAGATYLFYGPLPRGDVGLEDADAVFVGASAGERAGHAVVGGCDINGDGFADFIISSYLSRISGMVGGAVWVIYGKGR